MYKAEQNLQYELDFLKADLITGSRIQDSVNIFHETTLRETVTGDQELLQSLTQLITLDHGQQG